MTPDAQQPEYIRPSVMQFAAAMEQVLREHDKEKDGWEECGFQWLIERARVELNEVETAYDLGNGYNFHAAMEMIDVANFCMMFFDNATRLYPELKAHLHEDFRTRQHTPTPDDEMETRFTSKSQAWEQGYEDGSSAVQHDLNLIEDKAARTATLKAREDTLIEVIALLDTRTSAYTKVNLMLAKCRLDQRQQAGEQSDE